MASNIRLAIDTDIGAIHEIHVACIKEICSSHYTPDEISRWTGRQCHNRYLSNIQEGNVYVSEKGGTKEVVAFGHLHETDKEDCDYEVKALYVSPREVRKGIGRLLLQVLERVAMESGCRRLLVYSSRNAVEFYETFGFVRGECVLQCSGESMKCIKMKKLL